jgi:alanine racemase
MAYIKLNINNFFHNLNQFALKCGSKEKLAIVLKDNAYGHGLFEIASQASEFGIQEAVVRTYNEALQICKFFKNTLILNDKAFSTHQNLSFAINSMDGIKNAHLGSIVELKVDTGMHRSGIEMKDLQKALELIVEKKLILKGVMTHFRSADELSSELFWQQKNFQIVKEMVKNLGFEKIRFHSQNSASTLRCGGFDEDLVRIGIGAYGYSHLPFCYGDYDLKPVLSLWAKKTSLRLLKKSQRVGYGAEFIAPKEMLVSSYDIGYGDGFRRGDASKSLILANGKKILGRVSMDLITVEGDDDEICIFDDAHKIAQHFGTISYEMTTQLSPTMQRIIIDEI